MLTPCVRLGSARVGSAFVLASVRQSIVWIPGTRATCWCAVRAAPAPAVAAVGLARLAEARLELCPIDHGFCLPEGLEPPYFEWLHWPQVRFPRSLSCQARTELLHA